MALDDQGWRDLLAVGHGYPTLSALTYIKHWNSFSRPFAVLANGGIEIVVKCPCVGVHQARAAITDQVIARMAHAIGMPVAEPLLVDVSAEFIAINPQLAAITPGIAHATKLIPDCGDREWISPATVALNRDRYGDMAVLYGWAVARDHQILFRNYDPKYAYSVDHGFFLPNGPQWTGNSVDTHVACEPDTSIIHSAGLVTKDLVQGVAKLAKLSDDMIAKAVASPPSAWGITQDERVSLCRFFSSRRDLAQAWTK